MASRVVTIGNFDGVHLGHQALVQQACRMAELQNENSCAIFFDPHPASIVSSRALPPLLTVPPRRREILQVHGIHEVFVHPFDENFASLTPQQFVHDILVGSFTASTIVVGEDFRFGKNRAGDIDTLRHLGRSRGLSVHSVSPVYKGDQVVSSSLVRTLLQDGQVWKAAEMLGRVHDICSEVVHGDKKGRELGFPTANLGEISNLRPQNGVYAVLARDVDDRNGPCWQGVANLGLRPTRHGGPSTEVHLFDFSKDIYGRKLQVGFARRIRDEKAFSSLAALRSQIEQDCQEARAFFSSESDSSVFTLL